MAVKDLEFREFSGLNNVQDQQTLKPSEFCEAVNVVIDDRNRVHRRIGKTRVISGSSHSLFGAGGYALYRSGDNLYRMEPDHSTRVLMSGLGLRRLTYTQAANNVYFSDGIKTYKTDGINCVQAGIEPPIGQPDASSTSAGEMPEATYQYAMTYVSADGRESPTGVAGIVKASGGIAFTNIPVSADAQVVSKRIYITEPNGEDLLESLVIGNAATTATAMSVDRGMICETQFALPTPPATSLAYFNGSLLLGSGKHVWFTPPYMHHVVRPTSFFAMPSQITVIASMTSGFWLCTEQAIGWVGGIDGQFSKRADYGALPGTLAYRDNADGGKLAFVTTNRGICALSEDGSFKNLTFDTYHPIGTRGAAAFHRSDFNKYLASIR